MQRIQDLLIGVSLFVLLLWSAAVARGDEFIDSLNKARVDRGLHPVVEDKALLPVAKENNRQQAQHGQGHHYLGGFGQCAYVGPFRPLEALWGAIGHWGYINSPSHTALLFHPYATRMAVDQAGNCNTVVIAFGPPPTPKPVKKDVKPKGTTQPALVTNVVARPSMCPCRVNPSAGWVGYCRFRLFRRIR